MKDNFEEDWKDIVDNLDTAIEPPKKNTDDVELIGDHLISKITDNE
jgi:hypothetical protein